jgi:GMP synthase (glutamine-hydrolysing)
MRVYVLQHVETEPPGLIGEALIDRGIAMETIRTFADDRVPEAMNGRDALVVMGGPMGVYEQDRYPHLTEEIGLIRNAIDASKPVLGVCLGSQLLAAALGAEVAPAQREIGWFPVTLTGEAAGDPLWRDAGPSFTPFHWHGDAFDLPPGASLLASSARTPRQAFRHGENAYGFLFHMEMDPSMVRDMVETFVEELQEAGGDPTAVLAEAVRAVPEMNRIGRQVFARWAARIGRTP